MLEAIAELAVAVVEGTVDVLTSGLEFIGALFEGTTEVASGVVGSAMHRSDDAGAAPGPSGRAIDTIVGLPPFPR